MVAGFLYAWNATGNLEIFYAAAVRSMSMSWHNFVFAAFDPAGTITVDKLPGAFWVQALSVRVFGLHPWAIVAPSGGRGNGERARALPRRPPAGGPARRDRGRRCARAVSRDGRAQPRKHPGHAHDPAAPARRRRHRQRDRLGAAAEPDPRRGPGRPGVSGEDDRGVAGAARARARVLWQAPGASWRRRLARLAAAGAVVAAVSLSWMLFVTVWPASQRPYVDGSSTNSIFGQVFVYNGFGRLDQASPNQLLTKAIGLALGSAPPSWHRLLSGADGRDHGVADPGGAGGARGVHRSQPAARWPAARRHRPLGNVARRAPGRVQCQHDRQPVLHRGVVTRGRGAARDGIRARVGAPREHDHQAGGGGNGRRDLRIRDLAASRPGRGIRDRAAGGGRRARPRGRRRSARARATADPRGCDRTRGNRVAGGARGGVDLGRRQPVRSVRHSVRNATRFEPRAHVGRGGQADARRCSRASRQPTMASPI